MTALVAYHVDVYFNDVYIAIQVREGMAFSLVRPRVHTNAQICFGLRESTVAMRTGGGYSAYQGSAFCYTGLYSLEDEPQSQYMGLKYNSLTQGSLHLLT